MHLYRAGGIYHGGRSGARAVCVSLGLSDVEPDQKDRADIAACRGIEKIWLPYRPGQTLRCLAGSRELSAANAAAPLLKAVPDGQPSVTFHAGYAENQ